MPTSLDREFDGRVALVTGAASGIGRATALLFAARGATVACIDIADPACRETAALIGECGGESEAVLFLSSDRARFIHGVALPVDGGFAI